VTISIADAIRAASRARRSRFQVVPKGSTEEEKRTLIKAYKAAQYQANKEAVKARSKARYWADSAAAKAKSAAWYLANKEVHAASGKAWKEANPDRVKALSEKYRVERKAEISEANKRWRARHLEECRQRGSTFHQKNKPALNEKSAAWRRANPDKASAQYRRYRARKYSADGSHTSGDAKFLRAAQKDRCAYCRVALKGRGHLDHIRPLSRGGSDWPSNLQWLCVPCNLSKFNRDSIEFAQSMGKLL
jgi:5-methylcytosine-specific restriction endonuclease McrA